MDDNTKKELQSAAFDRLLNHLRRRKDVQVGIGIVEEKSAALSQHPLLEANRPYI